ncbi:hypothetical protein BCR41DRAFT_367840 [Lobosporangium transversale]|uniref:Uncharacterized protein n=1 Tax=Lobosporangium transversale TaxID=64571 RepID=A0A1Y2GYY4_9FUNG|nr:hypothetical protein BCR41DRAFT_367840 [Lobosporangium transversale]ORZ27519.1 hypothetical protein BCR41DRAFT_367840 [Lobosporangium transversale]|eukprot:XP_021885246.1 hypothetical protein BCR41DRAFT_367840 [Lobosporangium transversale]
MGHIFSETNVIAQKSRTSGVPQHDKIASGLRGPSYKSGTDTTPSSSPSALRKPGTISSPLSSSSSIPSPALQPRSRLSVPSKLSSLPSTGTISGLKQRSPAPATVIGMGPDLRQRESLSPPRLSSSSGPSRKITGLQQSPLSRPMTLNHHAMGNQSTTAIVSASPSFSFAQEITAENDGESDQMILKLTEELDRYRIELETYKQERVVADKMKKQISDLERDLETALDSLQTAEAKVIEADSQQQAVDSRISDFEKMIEGLKADLNMEKLKAEKALGDAAASQKQKLQELEIRNRELETKLTQAQDEIDQLELQVVPAELQDVHQSLFSATQELDEEKKRCEKLRTELAEEKAKIAREQEDSGQLLVKISQLQDTIANHIRDNNALKEVVKEHEKCQENAEVADHQYKKEVVRLQDEISIHQQSLTEEREQRSRVEQALQEQQYQSHQLQQQIQLQQTQLHQQQTEIVNLRASLEVEQRQTVLLQQKLQEEQRLNSQYGRRVSIDGDLNGSFLMVENNANGSNGINVGATPVVMTASSDIPLNMIGNNNMVSPGPGHPLSSSGPFSSMTTTATSLATGIQPIRGFDASSSSSSLLSNQINASSAQSGVQAAALPPMAPAMTHGGMATSVAGIATPDIEAKPGMIHRGSSSSITGIIANGNVGNNRLSLQDSLGSAGSSATTSGAAVAVGMQTIEELTTQLQHLIKEKERLQADLSKIPISGGGPMTRRKADMLEEQMDKTERAISKIRLNIRMQS